jgi:hypothetical protein
MRFPAKAAADRSKVLRAAVTVCIVFAAAFALSGCGTPGAPQPPSLRLPEPVNDLTAQRTGNTVTLHWTMPKKTTDRLQLSSQIRGPVPVRICLRESAVGPSQTAGETAFAPGAEAEFTETLPASLTTGKPRQLLYFVELRNKSGRSAGLSNPAVIAAGAVPASIAQLTAEVQASGVVLHWRGEEPPTAVRLHRRLLTPPTQEKKAGSKIMPTPTEPVLQNLLVDPATSTTHDGNQALDNSVRFGQTYEYTAQRIQPITLDGKALELAGQLSAPIRVEVIDTFPPAVPTGLAAVLVPEEKTIDLSWQPDTEEDLAGYFVYRASGDPESSNAAANSTRISGPQPIPSPAFRDTHIEPGHIYRYAVSAIDLTGHESQRSTEAQESVPNP